MIEWICDSCGAKTEHPDTNAPDGWATVKTTVGMRTGSEGSTQEWENEHAAALCPGCRGGSGQALEVRVEKILRAGLDSRPRPANG